MSAADVTPEMIANLRKAISEMDDWVLRIDPDRVLLFLDAIESAWAERDRLSAELQAVRDELATAYEEIILSRQSEGDTMADLLATREERDRLRSAPVAVEVPEPTDADWTMIKDQAESAGLEYPDGFYDGMAYARRNARTPSSPHIATSNKERYFWCDPEALDFHFTDTLEGARFQASNAIQSANEDCEDYEFKEDEKKICYGIVLGRAKEGHDSVDPEIPVLRLVDYPMMAPIPEPSVQQWIYEVLKPAEADPEPHATMRHATRWFREHIRPIPSDRVLNDGEVAIRADVLSAMEGCIATLRADDELIPSKALAHLDALRSKGGEA